jgi:hypothetical protein
MATAKSKPKQALIEPEPAPAVEFEADSNIEAESVRKALLELHAENYRSKGQGVPLPNGGRATVAPNVGMGYDGYDATTLLGSPETILKEPKFGHKYVWKIRSAARTLSWIRAGILRPVEVDEVDTTNPLAMYVADVKAAGTFVAWESLGLFEMPPKWVSQIYGGPENWAISRLAQQTADFDQQINSRTRGSYKGTLAVKDGKVESIVS